MTRKGFIRYRAGYEYQLAAHYQLQTDFKIPLVIDEVFITLTTESLLEIKKAMRGQAQWWEVSMLL
ncbi:hypothetical protein [Psychromonas hadalis]|uniref:hypothetical protein n=1 Tax=Psychromonas hadalis TaxID=211669 RepID=UPI0003B3AD50|nr:hypothetical protein [Psychromonas hadalis]